MIATPTVVEERTLGSRITDGIDSVWKMSFFESASRIRERWKMTGIGEVKMEV